MKKSRVTFRILFFALLVVLLALLCLLQLLNAENAFDMGVNVLTLFILSVLIYSIAHHSSHADALSSHIEEIQAVKPKSKKELSTEASISGISNVLSQELKEPLKKILGHLTLLREGGYGKIPDKVAEPFEDVEKSARLIADFADDMLLLSHIESKSLTYESSVFSLKVLGAKVVDELRSNSIKKGLLLLFRSDTETDMLVRADTEKVKKVIRILVDNALTYTNKGEVTVIAHDNKKKKLSFISVKDTGMGMSQIVQSKLFKKFERKAHGTEKAKHGTGLGLYIAKQMMEAMGGNIRFESKGEGKGSMFTIELPLAK